ncbi:MAG: 3-isopropylmalate dehydratase small subunit [Candidatus Omnitrophota bacterium]
MEIKGKVHKFGDDVNTDDIIAAKYLDSYDERFLGSKCMENIDAAFVSRVEKGDIIVAGKNFGCGSSREHAPWAIKGCGISLVIAKSFARIFYRNSINLGLPILISSDTDNLFGGDMLSVDLQAGEILNITKGKKYHCEKFPSFMRELINNGGLIDWIKRRNK